MSRFLGPIHHWMFRKIHVQNDMIEALLASAEEKNEITDLRSSVDKSYAPLESGSLEDLIDTDNIHGWLQDRVSLVENRLAFVVTQLEKNNPAALEEMKATLKALGTNHGQDLPLTTPTEAYKAMNDLLLDGMPCDNVIGVLTQDEDRVTWKRNSCIHKDYWVQNEGNPENFLLLREAWIEGLLENSPLKYVNNGDSTYTIERSTL